MSKYLLLIALFVGNCFADANLIYFVNGTQDSIQAKLTIDVIDKKQSILSTTDTPAFGRDSKIAPILSDGYITYETDDSAKPDDAFLIYESPVKVHNRKVVYIRSTNNNVLLGNHYFTCYFYKEDIDFTLSLTEYSNNGKVYYDYSFNYLPSQDNDVITLDNQDLINSSNDDLSKSCRQIDVSVEAYLQGLDTKKG